MADENNVCTQNLYFDTMLNHYLSQKLKLIRNDKFNHLVNILTVNEIKGDQVSYSLPSLSFRM